MALSVACLLASLEDDSADVRRAAVRALAKGAAPCDEAALGLLAKRTEDSDEDVRDEALSGLVSLVTRGSADSSSDVDNVQPDCRRKVVDAALRCLGDADGYVRRRAARATSVFCPKGDSVAISALVPCLRDDEREVRAAASDAVVEVSGRGNSQTVQEVLTLLQNSSGSTCSSGLLLLRRVAIRGDANALVRSLELCTNSDDVVRWAAARAVGALCTEGDNQVVDIILRLVEDQDEDVRAVALEALAAAAPKGLDSAWKAAMKGLWDSSSDVRQAAVDTLQAIAPRDDFTLLNHIRPCLSADEEVVRCAGLRALPAIFSVVGEDILQMILNCFRDIEEDVRQIAIETLAMLTPHGEATALDAVLDRLSSDEDEDVRCAAANALAGMAPKGSVAVISALADALNDQDRHVRSASAEALTRVSENGHDVAVTSLCKLLEDSADEVRQSAIDALGRLTTPNGASSPIGTTEPGFDALTFIETAAEELLSHVNEGTRCSAALGLAQLGAPRHVERIAKKLGELACQDPTDDDSNWTVLESVGDALAVLAARADIDEDRLPDLLSVIRPCMGIATSPRLRAVAAAAVVKLAIACNERDAKTQVAAAVQLLCDCFGDPDDEVRAAVANLMASLLAHENSRLSALALDTCLDQLKIAERSAQRAIATCLGEAWPNGNAGAVKSVQLKVTTTSSLLELRGGLECLAAMVAACAATVPPTDESTEAVAGAIETACACLPHEEEKVRNAAVKVLSDLRCAINKGGRLLDQLSDSIVQQVCDAVEPLLFKESEHVRYAGAKALGVSARPGDEAALSLLLRCLDDSDDDVRWIALQSLPKAAPRGDSDAVAAACRLSADGDEQVRSAAVIALATLAEKGDAAVLASLKPRLQDNFEVAREAMRSMVALFSQESAASLLEEVGSTVAGA